MAAAWIGFAGGVLAVLVSAYVTLRQRSADERLLLLGRRLDAEHQRTAALFDRELQAEEVLTRYRQPLAAAAYELQARLYNILKLDFVGRFGADHELAEEAKRTTLFRLAQYFGWSEILRRDVQFLCFPDDRSSRRVAELQSRIAELFLDSKIGTAAMIWRDEQRAIGELMIVEEHGKVQCMGYAAFSRCCDVRFAPWLERVWKDVQRPEARRRVLELQHALCDLVQLLDTRRVLYWAALGKA